MIDDEEVDAFLEHHGIKGQRWGFQTKDRSANKRGFTSTEKKVAVGAIAVGASIAAVLMLRHGAKPMSDLGHTIFEARDSSGNVISKIGSMVNPETLKLLI